MAMPIQQIQNPYNNEQMQEFLLQKFSTQDFDLLTKNYDFFLQYYKTNCPTEQQMDEKHLTMDFLSQFYHLNEFKKKLNGAEMEAEDNASGDEMQNDNDDDVVALDDEKEIDFGQQSQMTDAVKSKMGISNYNSNKRLRTTILPEQLNYLYECYQKESNPSRKQLEEISKKVNLKKRVVQVRIWKYLFKEKCSRFFKKRKSEDNWKILVKPEVSLHWTVFVFVNLRLDLPKLDVSKSFERPV